MPITGTSDQTGNRSPFLRHPYWDRVAVVRGHAMQLPRRQLLGLAAGAAILFVAVASAWSQSARAIRIVVPYPPGGGADVLSRMVADAVGSLHGPTMVIENRPGAGTVIGTADVVRAKPDGNTLLSSNNAVAIAPHMRKLDFDPLSSLAPICSIAATPSIIIVNSTSPYRTLDDLLGAARAKPGDLTFGATPGAKSDVDFEMILHPRNIRMTLVPFSGTPPIVNAVLGGQVDATFVDYPAAAGLLQAGKLRALAAGSRVRIEALPDVPTISESGFTDFSMEVWYGFFAPAQTPQPVISQLAEWFAKAGKLPELRSRLAIQGMTPDVRCGAPFASFLHKQYDDYGRAIRDANIKAE
jgi:tripartite-type tricarboxylate transporter receptor subunit TctC